jgi:hypothetical protein
MLYIIKIFYNFPIYFVVHCTINLLNKIDNKNIPQIFASIENIECDLVNI